MSCTGAARQEFAGNFIIDCQRPDPRSAFTGKDELALCPKARTDQPLGIPPSQGSFIGLKAMIVSIIPSLCLRIADRARYLLGRRDFLKNGHKVFTRMIGLGLCHSILAVRSIWLEGLDPRSRRCHRQISVLAEGAGEIPLPNDRPQITSENCKLTRVSHLRHHSPMEKAGAARWREAPLSLWSGS